MQIKRSRHKKKPYRAEWLLQKVNLGFEVIIHGKVTKGNAIALLGFVVYPESAPKDWRTILDKQGMTWVESPYITKTLIQMVK